MTYRVLWLRGWPHKIACSLNEQDSAKLKLCTQCIKPAFLHINDRCLYTFNKAEYMNETYMALGQEWFVLGERYDENYVNRILPHYSDRIDTIKAIGVQNSI